MPLHGRYHSIAATNASAYIEEDEIVIRGVMRETELFGHCLQLTRTIRVPAYGSEVKIEDVIENLGAKPEEFMILYHVNFGWPLLSEDARLVLPEGRKTKARTAFAETGLGRECEFDPPIDGEGERVFFHELPEPVAKLENQALGISAELSWSSDTLPVFVQWRSMASGEYVLGLEPSNSYIMGRAAERENGTLQVLEGFGKVTSGITLKFSSQP
jgi:hypothetical protein